MNQKNSLGLNICFSDLENPVDLFRAWYESAKQSEINDPNAVALATSDNSNQPNVRMVLLKGLSNKGFVFYTNLESRKGNELKNNQKAFLSQFGKSELFMMFNDFLGFRIFFLYFFIYALFDPPRLPGNDAP